MGSSYYHLVIVAEVIQIKEHTAARDHITPFYIDGAHVRGRLVRLDEQARRLLRRHNYPELVNQYLSELICVASVLAVDVKKSGIFTLQVTGGSLIRMMVVDITHEGEFRACAKFDVDQINVLSIQGETPSFYDVFGTAVMMFSVDLSHTEERYQAIVNLSGASFSDCVHHYFRQSDQIPTAIVIHSDLDSQHDSFCASALLLQQMPHALHETKAEEWHEDLCLLGTIKKTEMLDINLSSEKLLYRLFHERQLNVLPTQNLSEQCYCSRSRIEEVISQFGQQDVLDMFMDGYIEVCCDFCSEVYRFDEKDVGIIAPHAF